MSLTRPTAPAPVRWIPSSRGEPAGMPPRVPVPVGDVEARPPPLRPIDDSVDLRVAGANGGEVHPDDALHAAGQRRPHDPVQVAAVGRRRVVVADVDHEHPAQPVPRRLTTCSVVRGVTPWYVQLGATSRRQTLRSRRISCPRWRRRFALVLKLIDAAFESPMNVPFTASAEPAAGPSAIRAATMATRRSGPPAKRPLRIEPRITREQAGAMAPDAVLASRYAFRTRGPLRRPRRPWSTARC